MFYHGGRVNDYVVVDLLFFFFFFLESAFITRCMYEQRRVRAPGRPDW
jgi:hypothetical protein